MQNLNMRDKDFQAGKFEKLDKSFKIINLCIVEVYLSIDEFF